ncbi:hypothetical protein M9H77_26445 [Catharanthus roseus]|uniref:Uncharacterized protein n=1 Tax=Catharanthus roseus TaxID=4058 RepID=A0ACC0AB22_CATRO|nr:hypothetical protein M9H77_26445 [Catharanthus roseus]
MKKGDDEVGGYYGWWLSPSVAYSNIIKELKTTNGMNVTKGHLKNRMKTLEECFNECYDIFKNGRLSGFAWNPLKRSNKRWENKENGQQVNSIDEIDHLVSQNIIELEEFSAIPRRMNEHPKIIAAQQQKKSDVQSSKKRKMSNDEEFDVLKGDLHTVAEVIREGNSIMEKSSLRFILRKTSLTSWLLLRLKIRL